MWHGLLTLVIFNLSFGTRDRLTSLPIVQRALKRRVLECTLDDRKEGCQNLSNPFFVFVCSMVARDVARTAYSRDF